MFEAFRARTEAILGLAHVVNSLKTVLSDDLAERREGGNALDRIEALESTRAAWEAEVEATLLKSDSTLRSAKNAESRARTMLKHAETFTDGFDPDSDGSQEVNGTPVPTGYVDAGPEQGVLPMRVGLEADPKQIAVRAKFL